MTVWTVDPRALRPARLVPPVSKSDAQRALVIAYALGSEAPAAILAEEDPGALPADVRVMAEGLARLRGAADAPVDIDCADGGAPFRLLLGQAAATPGARVRFFGTARLGERPHRPLFDALRDALGPYGLVLREGAPWPLELTAPRATGEPVFRVAGAASSQYATSLLLAAATFARREGRPWTVATLGATASAGYLDLTVSWLERSGFAIERTGDGLTVAGCRAPSGRPSVPGDWSSLGYLLLAAWRAGGTVAHVDLDAAHPDRALLAVIGRAGLVVEPAGAGEVRVTGSLGGGLAASAGECPDLIPTLVALACVAPAPSVFADVEILRHKESDRLAGVVDLVHAAGGHAELEGGGRVRVVPPSAVRDPFAIDSRGDHRLAMAAATLAVLSCARLRLTDPLCVKKSFPGFWAQLAAAGVHAGE